MNLNALIFHERATCALSTRHFVQVRGDNPTQRVQKITLGRNTSEQGEKQDGCRLNTHMWIDFNPFSSSASNKVRCKCVSGSVGDTSVSIFQVYKTLIMNSRRKPCLNNPGVIRYICGEYVVTEHCFNV